MSLLDKASLIVTPNAYKASKLYSVIPNTTLGDMNVVRATTATRKNSAGLIESVTINIPRIDYTNGSCPSLLVEPQRTNIQLNSEDFSNASWTKTLSAVVANQINSPSGILTADKLNETATTGNHQLESSRNVTPGSYSMSVFAKKAEREWLYLFEDTTGKGAYFNLNNGTIGTIAAGATAKIENFGNGWYRCTVNYTEVGSFGRYRIAITTANGVSSYTGVANNGIYIWGAQYEAGAYATSLIPTVASTVTRNADVISKTGISSLIGQTEGTLFVDFELLPNNTNGSYLFALNDGTLANMIRSEIYILSPTVSQFRTGVNTLGVSQGDNFTTISQLKNKMAISYSLNNLKIFINGVLVATDTSVTIPVMNTFYLGNRLLENIIGSSYKQAILFKTQLTNAECIALTTL